MSRKGEKKQGTKSDRRKARKLYDGGYTFAAISREMGFDRNTIARWAKQENWRGLNLAEGLTPPTRSEKARQANTVKPRKPGQPENVVELRTVPYSNNSGAPGDDLDNLTMVTDALRWVSTSIENAAVERDYRGLGVLATSLDKLIQLRLKLSPQSARALAQRAIELELTPESFIDALAEQWRLKGAA